MLLNYDSHTLINFHARVLFQEIFNTLKSGVDLFLICIKCMENHCSHVEQESEKNRDRGRGSCLKDDRAASTHQLHSRSNRHRRPLLLLVYSLTTWQQEIKTVAHYTKPMGLSLILGNFPREFAANLNYNSYSSHIQYLCCLCIFIQ